jgi:hypothetical protein
MNASNLSLTTDIGRLGVFHLKRFWSRTMAQRAQAGRTPDNPEWVHDKIVMFGLGLALEETIQYLFQTAPSFEEFEDWILTKHNGSIDSHRIERVNRAIGANENRAQMPVGPPILTATDRTEFENRGYVIVHDAVTPSQCQAAVNAIAAQLEIALDDPATWYGVSRDHGIMHQFFHHPALIEVRDSPRIHRAFAELWDTADLWVTVDRVSFNPPERSGWTFPGPRLHWDVSLELPIPFGLQGLVYLTDTTAEQGAFTCVPGFHRRIQGWLQSLPADADPRQQDLVSLGAEPIPGRAGDLIIWHQALPHGSRPNTATQPRFVQYVYLFPFDEEHQNLWR